MADITIVTPDDCATAFGGAMKLLRDGLGVESFGIQVIDMPANADAYPEHTHEHDGQEEVYTVLRGTVTLHAGDEQHQLGPESFVRIGPGERRKFVTGEEPVRLLAIGAVPGKAYEVSDFTRAPQNA
jgi:mannose-6-phosphate isomerase-like protein (cupin superfamily)